MKKYNYFLNFFRKENNKVNSALTEVLEKNSELEDKPEKRESSILENKYFPPENNENNVYTPKIKAINPKFYHHFACQRIFADRSFGF